MHEALRLAIKAAAADEVPAQGRNRACRNARIDASGSGRGRLATDRLRSLRDQGAMRNVRGCARSHPDQTRDFRLRRSSGRRRGKRNQSPANAHLESPMRYRIWCFGERVRCDPQGFFSRKTRRRQRGRASWRRLTMISDSAASCSNSQRAQTVCFMRHKILKRAVMESLHAPCTI